MKQHNFDRYALFYEKSLAWRLFKRHHTHFNNIYWAHSLASSHTYESTRPHERQDAIEDLFPKARERKRSGKTLGEWADFYDDFESWTRMASIVAISGYLETYIAQITTAAMESCPSVFFGGGPKIDGAIYLKKNPKYDLHPTSEAFTRGDWQSRINEYKKHFGYCPFESCLSRLEKLRKLRNDAGHSFGRNIKIMRDAPSWNIEKIKKINTTQFTEFLALVDTVASLIEKHLAKEYVGQYELIKAFHKWLPTTKTPINQPKILAKEFSIHIYQMTQNNYSKHRALNLITYYNNL